MAPSIVWTSDDCLKIDMSGKRNQQRGTIILGVAVSAVTLVGFLGLAVDIGYLEWTKIRAQTAADSAALGALWEKKAAGSTSTTVIAAGRNDSSLNGFTHNGNDVIVTISNPPTSGTYAGNSSAVEAVVQRNVGTFFMGVVGADTAQVRSRAVTLLSSPSSGGSDGCVYALNATAQQGFSIAGSTAVYFSCSVYVNSNSNKAFKMEGSQTLYMKNEATVYVVGDSMLTGQTAVRDFEDNSLEPPVDTTAFTDPLADVEAPSGASLVLRGSSTTSYDMNSVPSGNTIQPGVYCEGLRIGNTGSATFTLAPGVYVMGGGGFWLGSQAKVTGTGVTIYNTNGAGSGKSACGTTAFFPFDITGQASVSLKAPTSGSLKGILIMQDRSISGSQDNKIVGGASTIFDGAVYTKGSPVMYSGNSSSTGYTIIVADKITINGNSSVGNNYSSLDGGTSPVAGSASKVALVE